MSTLPSSTTLSVSPASLALAARSATVPTPIPGTARVLTITNTGSAVAQAVALDPSADLPPGTTVVGNCGTLAPLARCTLTITPGAVATTTPVTLSVQGSNTNTVSSTVQVLAYGSVYQGGYVFAIDDSTPNTGSVGGKVAALVDTAALPWSSNNDLVAGIDEGAVWPCEGAVDGACNTNAIVTHYTALLEDPSTYAAGACAASTAEGFTDWYLPAICEMGYDGLGRGSGCGTAGTPKLQNMFSNLVESGGGGGLVGRHWSSTTATWVAGPGRSAWLQVFPTKGPTNSRQGRDQRTATVEFARCVRALTL